MSDPRNVAHDKKVSQEKKHHGVEVSPEEGHAVQPGKKAAVEKKGHSETQHTEDVETSSPAAAPSPEAIAIHEGSLAVLTQLKDMEFHSRANLERLAALMLTVEDELKQKAFVEPLGEIFSFQDAFQTKLTVLIEAYQVESDKMPGA